MIINCPECKLPISDKAFSCPHCGYPLKTNSIKRAKYHRKRMRLPNGFGQITELKGNLRKPFRAMVTIGKTDEGKPICKLLRPEAYFKTYNDAYQALMEYHRDPYTLKSDMTVQELYERWSESYFKNVSESSIRTTKASWRYCDSVKKMKVIDLRARHIRYCMEEGTYTVNGETKYPPASMKIGIKSIFKKMMDYAVEYELVDKNYANTLSISKEDKRTIETNRENHIPYTDDEITKLWENINKNSVISIILIQCYTGWRPKELELLKFEDVNLEEGYMQGGVKTKAGKKRMVPIHSKIYDLVKYQYENSKKLGSEYFITVVASDTGKIYPFQYHRFSRNLKQIVEELGLNKKHKPHDGRAHFISQAKKYHLDEYAIKRIVGHEIDDITESVYTTRDLSWLKQEIEKIG